MPVGKPFPIHKQALHRAIVVWSASTEVLAMSPVPNSCSLWALQRALKLVAHLWVAHKGLLAFEVLFVLGMLSFAKKTPSKAPLLSPGLCIKGTWVLYTVPNAIELLELLKHRIGLRVKELCASPASCLLFALRTCHAIFFSYGHGP